MIRVNNNQQTQPGFADNQVPNQFSNNQFQSNPQQAFNQSASFDQSQDQLNNQPTPNQGFFKIPESILQWIPWIPMGLEMLTGQKIPPIGVMADILQGIQQLQFQVQQSLNQQQLIWNKLVSLENNASSQLTNLSQQLTNTKQDFRVFATETKKSLEFQGNQNDLEQARKFIPRSEPEPNYNEPIQNESEY